MGSFFIPMSPDQSTGEVAIYVLLAIAVVSGGMAVIIRLIEHINRR